MWRVRRLDCGHDSAKAIVSDNKIKCIIPVERKLFCGHTRWVPCYVRYSAQILGNVYRKMGRRNNEFPTVPVTKCSEIVDIIHPCGRHMYAGECHESTNPKHCEYKCDLRLPCGHNCRFFCHQLIQEQKKLPQATQYMGVSVTEVPTEEVTQGLQCPPCDKVVSEKLPCGHETDIPCSNKDLFIQAYKCNQTCNKRIVCGHICKKKCGEPCTPCSLVVRKRRPGLCSHDIYTECFVDAADVLCPELVPAHPRSTCGHEVLVPCGGGRGRNFKPNWELLQICDAPCNSVLNCGHVCSGICSKCLQGRFHVRCRNPCDNILPCRHKCVAFCSEPCPPCQDECGNVCSHRKCDLNCGEICVDCKEPCDYKCLHGACKRMCFELCDKEPCYEPCEEPIPSCGHPCVGFCGEICPPYCFICDKEKLAEGNLFGDTPEESDRYILLPDCGHVIEIHSMEGWMQARRDEEEITPIFCPLCRAPIRQLKRYSQLLSVNRGDILKIMSLTNGDIEENSKRWTALLASVHNNENTHFRDMKKFLLNFLIGKSVFYKAELDCVAQYWQFVTATDKILLDVYDLLPKNRWSHLERLFNTLFQHLEGRKIPLNSTEVKEFNREILRAQHAVEIQKRHRKDANNAVKNFIQLESTKRKFNRIYNHLMYPTPYTVERENQFLENLHDYDQLINVNLNISEDEKMSIIQAFGNQAGRWFKCRKGHVYVITECGGAVEKGLCYECGETIGGIQHRAEEGNVLATEMDGAEEPLYPHSVKVLEFKD